MGGQRVCEPVRGAPDAPSAGRHPKSRGRNSCLPQAIPKIMIFSTGKVCPSSRFEISIRANSKICTMNVRMSSIGVDEIADVKAFLHFRTVLAEGVHRDNSGRGLDAFLGEKQLLHKPVLWNDAIGIRMSKPTQRKHSIAAAQCAACRCSPRATHDSSVCDDDLALSSQNLLRNLQCSIRGCVDGNDDVPGDMRGNMLQASSTDLRHRGRSSSSLRAGMRTQICHGRIIFSPSGLDGSERIASDHRAIAEHTRG